MAFSSNYAPERRWCVSAIFWTAEGVQSAVRSVSQAIPGYLAGALLLPPEDYLLGGFARPRLVGELTRLAAEAAVAAICEACTTTQAQICQFRIAIAARAGPSLGFWFYTEDLPQSSADDGPTLWTSSSLLVGQLWTTRTRYQCALEMRILRSFITVLLQSVDVFFLIPAYRCWSRRSPYQHCGTMDPEPVHKLP